MLPDKAQTAPALQVDLIAIDALFKRIAKHGRKVRTQTQKNSALVQNAARPENFAEESGQAARESPDPNSQGKESKHEQV